jgi:hypothetical protein
MSSNSRLCLTLALLAVPLLSAAGCDVAPVEDEATAGSPCGGLSGRPVNGRMLRYTRARHHDGLSSYLLDTLGAPVAVRLSFTAAAPAQGRPAALDAEHLSELLLERAGARRCIADVEGLGDVIRPSGPATVRLVGDEAAGRFDGVLTIAGLDRRDREVKLVVEFSPGE